MSATRSLRPRPPVRQQRALSGPCSDAHACGCARSLRSVSDALACGCVRSARVTNKKMNDSNLVVTIIGPDGEDVITVDQRQLYRCALQPSPKPRRWADCPLCSQQERLARWGGDQEGNLGA